MNEPLIDWPHVLQELATFTSIFLVTGAIGFRWSGLRAAVLKAQTPDEHDLLGRVHRAIAGMGLFGAAWMFALAVSRLPEAAARRQLQAYEMLLVDFPTALQFALLGVMLLGFVLTLTMPRRPIGWILAGIGFLGLTLRSGLLGRWDRVVNPVHRAAGGLWIGTLFMLVAIGMLGVMRSALPGERRGRLAAEMVHGFSPLALVSAMVLVGFGIITAVQHIPWPAALWTTPYGITFLIKLGLVMVVFALGAFHWLGVRPKLGAEAEAGRLLGSARTELMFAVLVLLVTAVLVSVPTPEPPQRP
jgi:copper transport protein